MNRFRTCTWPAAGAGSGTVTSSKLSRVGNPCGRETSLTSRLLAVVSIRSPLPRRGAGASLSHAAGRGAAAGPGCLDWTLMTSPAGSALDALWPQVYDELRRLARRSMRDQRGEHTLQPTALV